MNNIILEDRLSHAEEMCFFRLVRERRDSIEPRTFSEDIVLTTWKEITEEMKKLGIVRSPLKLMHEWSRMQGIARTKWKQVKLHNVGPHLEELDWQIIKMLPDELTDTEIIDASVKTYEEKMKLEEGLYTWAGLPPAMVLPKSGRRISDLERYGDGWFEIRDGEDVTRIKLFRNTFVSENEMEDFVWNRMELEENIFDENIAVMERKCDEEIRKTYVFLRQAQL